jgi:outer membrane protein TolC
VIFPENQFSASIRATIPLIDGPAIAQWQAARDGTDAAEHDEIAVMNDLRLEVARAWYVAVAAQEVVIAAERARAAADENLRTVRIRAEAGAATGLSVQRAELEVANAEQLMIDAERVRLVSLRTLATLSGLPEPEALPVVAAAIPAQVSEQEALAIAEASRPELAAARARVDQLKLARSGAWLGYTPTLSGFASEEYTNASGFSGEEAFWTVGLQADWLLLDFGDRGADVKRARAALVSAEATLQETQDRVRDEVHAAWLDVEAAQASVQAATRGATVSREAAREFTARFQLGMSTQFDVIQADRDALDAEVARIRAEGELAIAVLALQRATGQPIEP